MYRIINIFLFTFVLVHFTLNVSAQNTDTLVTPKHSPKRATIMSAVLPGSGQFYNKKYWKIPVIYAGFGTLGYFLVANQTRYKDYKTALKLRTDNDASTVDAYPFYSEQGLLQAKNYYRRNVELSYIFTAVLYTLNVVDAAVDAHLYNFDINDDLSMKIQPAIINTPLAYNKPIQGIKLTLTLKN